METYKLENHYEAEDDLVYDGNLEVEGDLACRSLEISGDVKVGGDLKAQWVNGERVVRDGK